jgi:hypothetical protein
MSFSCSCSFWTSVLDVSLLPLFILVAAILAASPPPAVATMAAAPVEEVDAAERSTEPIAATREPAAASPVSAATTVAAEVATAPAVFEGFTSRLPRRKNPLAFSILNFVPNPRRHTNFSSAAHVVWHDLVDGRPALNALLHEWGARVARHHVGARPEKNGCGVL